MVEVMTKWALHCQQQGDASAPFLVSCKALCSHSITAMQVCLKTSVGLTPLHNAASNSHVAVIEVLIRAGASVNARAGSNATALFIAAQNGHAEVLPSGAAHTCFCSVACLLRMQSHDPAWPPVHVSLRRLCHPFLEENGSLDF